MSEQTLEYEVYKRMLIEERIKKYPEKSLSKILDVEYEFETDDFEKSV